MTHQKQSESEQTFYPWAEFGRVAKIQGWIEELKKIKDSQPTAKDWRLMGRAVMVCHPIDELRKPLIQKIAHEAGYDYLWISGETFFEWAHECKSIPGGVPVIVHVEQGIWSGKIEDDKKAAEELAAFQANDLPNYLSELPNDLIVVFVITGKSYADLNPTIRTVGSFDRRFDIAEPTMADLGTWFLNQIGTELCDGSLLKDTGRVGKLINDEFEDRRRQRLIALHLQRRANREARQLNFDDLVYFAVHGGSETDHAPEEDAEMRHRIAVHEAGHALVSIIDSSGRNMPDYCSILPGGYFKGIVADSYAYCHALTGKYTYEDSRHKIRTQLAGRVAEAVVFGPTKVGTFGARSDLRNATTWAKELVGICGFSAEQENPDAIRDNLAVIDDDPSDSEAAHIETQTRLLLKRQYEAVELIILNNRALLDLITQELLNKGVLKQAELDGLMSKYETLPLTNLAPEKASAFIEMNPLLTELSDLFSGKNKTDIQGITSAHITELTADSRSKICAAIQTHIFLDERGIVFYALNKTAYHYAGNIIAMFSALTIDQLFGGNLTEQESKRMLETFHRFIDAPIFFDQTHSLNSNERVNGLLRLKRANHPKNIGAIICDRKASLDQDFVEYCARGNIELVMLEQ